MSSNPVVGSPDMSLDDASRIMSEQQIRRLPVVENQKLVALGDLAVQPNSDQKAGNALTNIS
ncbi:CBS domain-containing protein [Clostridium vincentii]|nr:CBS domain-containing protein [Clostridium vincentii]